MGQFTMQHVNETGIREIQEFLGKNHKLGKDHFTRDMLLAWATDAEFQLGEGNPASIEIPAYDCVKGYTMTYTISDAGLYTEIIDVDE